MRVGQRDLRLTGIGLAGAAVLYGGSLFVVTVPSTWDWGHVAVAGLWAVAAGALVATRFRLAALTVIGAATLLVLGYGHDAAPMPESAR